MLKIRLCGFWSQNWISLIFWLQKITKGSRKSNSNYHSNFSNWDWRKGMGEVVHTDSKQGWFWMLRPALSTSWFWGNLVCARLAVPASRAAQHSAFSYLGSDLLPIVPLVWTDTTYSRAAVLCPAQKCPQRVLGSMWSSGEDERVLFYKLKGKKELWVGQWYRKAQQSWDALLQNKKWERRASPTLGRKLDSSSPLSPFFLEY